MDARAFLEFYVDQSNLIQSDGITVGVGEDLVLPFEFLRFDHCYLNNATTGTYICDVFIGLLSDVNPFIWWEDPDDQKTLILPLIHI